MLSSAGGFLSKLDEENSDWPHASMQLALDSTMCDVLRKEKPCRLDEWTLEYKEYWAKQPGGLFSQECRADAMATNKLARDDNVLVEVGHASVRRKIKSASVQTFAAALKDISARFCLQKVRSHSAPMRSRARAKAIKRRTRIEARKRDAPIKTRRRPRATGGAWRAFIRRECLGRNSADFADLAFRYKALSVADKQELKKIGKRATRRGRVMDPNCSTFGPTKRTIRRQKKQATRAAEVAATVQQAEEESGPPQKKRRCAPRLADGVVDIVPVTVSMQVSSSEIDRVRHEAAIVQAARTQLEEHRESQFQDWLATDGKESLRHVYVTDTLAARAAEFAPEPESSMEVPFDHLHWRPIAVADRVKTALKSPPSDNTKPLVKLKTSLDSLWSAMHGTVQHVAVPEVTADSGPVHRPCNENHMCVCEGDGAVSEAMHVELSKVLRRACPAKSTSRTALDTGRMFICLQGYRRACGPCDREGYFPLDHECTHWLHATNPNLTTFRFQVEKMHLAGNQGGHIIYIPRTWQVSTRLGI